MPSRSARGVVPAGGQSSGDDQPGRERKNEPDQPAYFGPGLDR